MRLLAITSTIVAAVPLSAQENAICEVPWHLEDDLRMGSVDGDIAFSWIRDLEIGPSGEIYVAQGFDHEVAVFNSDGTLERRIGRSGGGPGEFSSTPYRLGWRGDTLVAVERSAVLFFGEDGEELRRVRFNAWVPSESSSFMAGLPLADGSFLGYRFLRQPLQVFYEADHLPLRRFSESGELLQPIAMIDHPAPVGDASFRAEFPNRVLSHPLTYWAGDSSLQVAVTRDGQAAVLVANLGSSESSSSYHLLKIGVDGDTIWSRALEHSSTPISRQERTTLREGFAGQFAGDFAPPNVRRPPQAERVRRAASRGIQFPEEYPPFREIITGNDGTIWLLRESKPQPEDLWEVYSETGVLEGLVRITEGSSGRLPWLPRFQILRASREFVWGVAIDDLDVPYIHRFKVIQSCS